MTQTVTLDFKQAWQLRCATRNTATERCKRKSAAHRHERRQIRQLDLDRVNDLIKPSATGWDVV